RIGGRALLPRTRYWHARMLRARGDADDDRVAGTLLDGVIAETSALGMARLCTQAEELGGSGELLRCSLLAARDGAVLAAHLLHRHISLVVGTDRPALRDGRARTRVAPHDRGEHEHRDTAVSGGLCFYSQLRASRSRSTRSVFVVRRTGPCERIRNARRRCR